MELKEIIQSQYLAALAMLEQVIQKCPNSLWVETKQKNQFWRIAYHVLFYVHLYLQPEETDFVPWEKHQEHYPLLDEKLEFGKPYSQEEVLAYLQVCRRQVKRLVPLLDLHGPSGFYWLPFSKIELQFYNIRHLQQHTGELSERLWVEANQEINWVGMVDKGE